MAEGKRAPASYVSDDQRDDDGLVTIIIMVMPPADFQHHSCIVYVVLVNRSALSTVWIKGHVDRS